LEIEREALDRTLCELALQEAMDLLRDRLRIGWM